jgi:hypothetical protein
MGCTIVVKRDLERDLSVKRDLPGGIEVGLYYSVKRDLLNCQKRPITVSKETHQAAPPPWEVPTLPRS